MNTIRIRDIVQSGQFEICGKHRILRFLGIEHHGACATMWDSESGTLPPDRLLGHEVTAIHITPDGCMEIEYDGSEYMGPEEDWMISNINDLAEYLNTIPEFLHDDVRGCTDCDVWISWDDASVKVGANVEGSDAKPESALVFPFPASAFNDLFEELERLVDEAEQNARESAEGEE